jgi:hypothetical protein
VRYFFRHGIPQPSRILLIESGSRRITDMVIPRFRALFGDGVSIDLVTCFAGELPALAGIYNVNHSRWRERRISLVRELRTQNYTIAAIICSNEPTLNKWKWALVAALPAKFLVINENGDSFWLDRGHWANIRQFVKHRAGVANAGIVRATARVVVFPLTLSYLLLYAAAVHFRRALYRGFR